MYLLANKFLGIFLELEVRSIENPYCSLAGLLEEKVVDLAVLKLLSGV